MLRSSLVRCSLLAFFTVGPLVSAPRAGGAGVAPRGGSLPEAVVAALRAEIEKEQPRIVERWIALSQIPSPSGDEAGRAAALQSSFRELGLEEVRRDEIGNVIGLLPGRSRRGRRIVYAAHLDTVASRGADVTVSRIRSAGVDRLRGPGIRDDASGLVGVIEAARALRKLDLAPPGDVWLVATVQEETGLLGARKFLDDNASRVAGFVAVDGEAGDICYGATAITWLKMHFLAPGAHTLRSRGEPSATLAAARAIEEIYRLPVPGAPESRESWLNVGTIGGGEVVNAMARDAWFTVDLRSNDPQLAAKLEAETRSEASRAARRTGVGLAIEELLRLPGASPVGGEDSFLVTRAAEALRAAGFARPRIVLRGTSDHNRALERRLPGISIGVTTGTGVHTPDETADVLGLAQGITALAILMASLAAE